MVNNATRLMQEILSRIKSTPDCYVFPPQQNTFKLPDDLPVPLDITLFYNLSNGAVFFSQSEYRIDIVPIEQFKQANPEIILGLTNEEMQSTINEASWNWYIIGKGDTGEYIVIDLHPQRLGYCYYGFWDSYAMKGHTPIIASTFSELLLRLLQNQGQSRYWEAEGFLQVDAYNNIQDG